MCFSFLLEGKHLRHARDHYELLLDSLNDTGEVVSELSYDVRSRGTPMESSREAACAALESTASRLEAIVPRVRLDAPLTLNAVTPHPQTLGTTFGREVRPFLSLSCFTLSLSRLSC